jgi:DNA-binding LytR/AlgR family response regulator
MKIIVCDDDKNMKVLLESWMQEYFEETGYQILYFSNGIELLNRIDSYQEEETFIIFMDIRLKNDNGIDIARAIRKKHIKAAIIFISGYTEYVEDSFEADPDYFLVKPLKKESFWLAMNKSITNLSVNHDKYVRVKTGKEIRRIRWKDIYYAESLGRKIKLYCTWGTLEYYDKMDRLEKELEEEFVRSHKSYLVHLEYVDSMEGNKITLFDEKEIPVSKNRSLKTREKIFSYFGEQL